jgi:beta-N-acetylhexosaminidase
MNKINLNDIDTAIKALSTKQKLAQLFLMNFVGKYEIPAEIQELNRKGLLGGIIYFSGSNVEDIDQLKALNAKVQGLAAESPTGLPYFTTLDQEGGQLTALHRGSTVFPGNMALGDANDTALTRAYARHVGRELKYAGISINFAPVLDCSIENTKHGVHIVDNRMLSSDPATVAKHGVELIAGIQEEGVIACGKHFPGMRVAEVDTHHATDIIDYPLEQLEKEYFPAFRAAVKAGVGAIMTHHGVYPAFDDKPATISKRTLDFLRSNMGYQGLIITDDLIMHAVQDHFPGAEGCILAINAGVDLIIFTGAGEKLLDDLEAAVNDGRIEPGALEASLRRVLKAKQEWVLPGIAANAGATRPASAAGEALALSIARKAIRVTKNQAPEGGPLLPLTRAKLDAAVKESRHSPAGGQGKVSVIMANPARLVMSCTVNFYDISLKKIIEQAQLHPYVKEAFMPWTPTAEEALSLFDIGFISDVLIFTTVNAYRFEDQLKILKQIHGLRQPGRQMPRIIAVATRSPDDAALLAPYADAVLTTAGITEAQMTALAETIFGKTIR